MKIKIMIAALFCITSVQAGWFAHQSESYLIQTQRVNTQVYQCTYKTNPGNRGWINFHVNFHGGCPRFVLYNANNGQVTVPN